MKNHLHVVVIIAAGSLIILALVPIVFPNDKNSNEHDFNNRVPVQALRENISPAFSGTKWGYVQR